MKKSKFTESQIAFVLKQAEEGTAIAEVCRNLVCSGAEPIGITDCLNFASPEDPVTMDRFARAIDGLAAACKALDVPIVSGNVSLYNETTDASGRRPILPTPTVAAVGLIRDEKDIVRQWFVRSDEAILLLGAASQDGVGGSEYQALKAKQLGGPAPAIDLDAEAKLQKLVLELARAQLLSSAHDVADGGLAVALAECCVSGPAPVGADITLEGPPTSTLFGEAPTRVVISTGCKDEVAKRAAAAGVPIRAIGRTAPTDKLGVRVGTLVFELDAGEITSARDACLASIVGAS